MGNINTSCHFAITGGVRFGGSNRGQDIFWGTHIYLIILAIYVLFSKNIGKEERGDTALRTLYAKPNLCIVQY